MDTVCQVSKRFLIFSNSNSDKYRLKFYLHCEYCNLTCYVIWTTIISDINQEESCHQNLDRDRFVLLCMNPLCKGQFNKDRVVAVNFNCPRRKTVFFEKPAKQSKRIGSGYSD